MSLITKRTLLEEHHVIKLEVVLRCSEFGMFSSDRPMIVSGIDRY
jgi:hypothetical protein